MAQFQKDKKQQQEAMDRKKEAAKLVLEQQIKERQNKNLIEKQNSKLKFKSNLGPEESDDHQI